MDTALNHINSERDKVHSLLQVISIQRQIVSGVKFILTLEVVPTVCLKNSNYISRESCPIDQSSHSEICQVEYIQKPWISKTKYIFHNNCTVSQEYTPKDEEKLSNEIDVNGGFNKKPLNGKNNINFDRIAETGNFDEEEIDPARLADIESQIEVEPFKDISSEIIAQSKPEKSVQSIYAPKFNTKNHVITAEEFQVTDIPDTQEAETNQESETKQEVVTNQEDETKQKSEANQEFEIKTDFGDDNIKLEKTEPKAPLSIESSEESNEKKNTKESSEESKKSSEETQTNFSTTTSKLIDDYKTVTENDNTEVEDNTQTDDINSDGDKIESVDQNANAENKNEEAIRTKRSVKKRKAESDSSSSSSEESKSHKHDKVDKSK